MCSRNAATFDPTRDLGGGLSRCLDTAGNWLGYGYFKAIGDRWIVSQDQCVRLKKYFGGPGWPAGCGCNETFPGSGICNDVWRLSEGWRSETQVTRFLWDMIDDNNEGGPYPDLTNYLTMSDFVSIMEAMPCSSSSVGVDGTCNEPARWQVTNCNPVVDGTYLPAGSPMTGSRDSYNVWDIAEMIPGGQANERILNCVQGAGD